MARPIDAYQAIDIIDEWLDSVGTVMVGKGLSSYGELIGCIEDAPTLTQPNEWISVEERLPEPGDLIVYADNTVWGYQYGICRVCGKEKAFDYWIPLQDPPNNRPPEGEEDT
jgi:hypothetical protein